MQGEEDRESRHALILAGSFFEAYDTSILGGHEGPAAADLVPPANSNVPTSGLYTRGETSLFYGRARSQVKFGALGRAAVNYYHDVPAMTGGSYQGFTDLSVAADRITFSGKQTASYSPYFVFSAFPILVNADGTAVSTMTSATNVDLVATQEVTKSYSSSLKLSRSIARHSSVDLAYDLSSSNTGGTLIDLSSQAASSSLRFQTGRRTAIRTRYEFRAGEYSERAAPQRHVSENNLDVGIELTKPFSPSRRLTMVGSFGAALLSDREAGAISDASNRTRLVGSGSLQYQVGQTWDARVEFRRSAQLVLGFAKPFFANGVTALVTGGLGRRLDASVGAGYSQGEVGVTTLDRGYNTRTGSFRLRYVLCRQVGLTTEYVYYHYEFAQAADLPLGIPRDLTRQVARVGLMFGAPLLGHRPQP